MNFLLIILILLAVVSVLIVFANALAPTSGLTISLNRIWTPGSFFSNFTIWLGGLATALLMHKYTPNLHKSISPAKESYGKKLINS